VESGQFDTLQTTFNLLGQEVRIGLFAKAEGQGMGIIAKRPIANAAWRAPANSSTVGWYRQRMQTMLDMGPIPGAPQDLITLALGFTLAHPEVDTAIVGTCNLDHMLANIKLVKDELPIPAEVVQELSRRFDLLG
jgi:aryl-alcohol dehydrogenase-like predicted oxidoreductase